MKLLPRFVTKHPGSNSVRALAAELGSIYGRKIWLSSRPHSQRLNLVYGDCCDKLSQYRFFEAHALPSVPFTTSRTEACAWLDEGKTVFARTLIKASEGRGIVQIGEHSDMVQAPVYTQYVPKKREFRIHVFRQQIIQTLEKKRKTDGSYQGESKVRNTVNGYIFCQGITIEPSLQQRISALALKAALVTKSDFKGVDIGYNEKKDFLFVIEVNSAPGITGSNISKYCSAIVGMCHV